MIRIALDSNILAYLAGVCRVAEDEAKIAASRGLIAGLAGKASLLAPAQALGELFIVLMRGGATADEARAILVEFSEAFRIAPSQGQSVTSAADLVVDHRLQFWDALILTAAAEAGCNLLLSEDMQHGFVMRGVTVVNPLRDEAHPKLAAILAV